MPNHPAPQLVISESERASLQALLRAGTTEQRLVMRARIVLAAAEGTANERIAAQLGVHRMTVLLWRGRFERDRLAGLDDAPRPGREPTYDRAARDRVNRPDSRATARACRIPRAVQFTPTSFRLLLQDLRDLGYLGLAEPDRFD